MKPSKHLSRQKGIDGREEMTPKRKARIVIAVCLIMIMLLYGTLYFLAQPPEPDYWIGDAQLSITVSQDAENWTANISGISISGISFPTSGVPISMIILIMFHSDYAHAIGYLPLSDFNNTWKSGVFFFDHDANGLVNIGDTFFIDKEVFESGSELRLIDENGIHTFGKAVLKDA